VGEKTTRRASPIPGVVMLTDRKRSVEMNLSALLAINFFSMTEEKENKKSLNFVKLNNAVQAVEEIHGLELVISDPQAFTKFIGKMNETDPMHLFAAQKRDGANFLVRVPEETDEQ
jgi:hypothetical protein